MKTLRLPLVFAVLAAALPAAAAAQRECESPMTQAGMNECAAAGARAADRRLDALLAELAPQLDAARAGELRAIQARWREHRDAHCRWDADSYARGSAWSMFYSGCFTDLTWQRIDELRFHLCNDDAGMAGECEASLRYLPPRAGKAAGAES